MDSYAKFQSCQAACLCNFRTVSVQLLDRMMEVHLYYGPVMCVLLLCSCSCSYSCSCSCAHDYQQHDVSHDIATDVNSPTRLSRTITIPFRGRLILTNSP